MRLSDSNTSPVNNAPVNTSPLGPKATSPILPGQSEKDMTPGMAWDSFKTNVINKHQNADSHTEEVANTSQQLFGAGNTQNAEDLLPGFAVTRGKQLGNWLQGKAALSDGKLSSGVSFAANFPEDHPTALSRLKVAGRLLGPLMATASLGWSVADLATHWKKLSSGAKIANVAATGATAVGAGAAFAALSHAPWAAAAGTVAWGGLGAASAIYQGIKTFQYFKDPNATSGQRGLSLASTVMQGAGAALIFTPVGLPLLVAGGVIGMLAGTLGKWGPINSACKWLGKKLGPVAHALAPVGHAIAKGVQKAGEAIGHAAHAVGHFFSSIF